MDARIYSRLNANYDVFPKDRFTLNNIKNSGNFVFCKFT